MDQENVVHNGILLNHKKNGILSYASKWIQLENILSEVSQAQKTKKSYILPHMRTLNLEQT
jgi:hypothetical protein